MNNSSVIKALLQQRTQSHKDANTEQLLEIARDAVVHSTTSSDQREELSALIVEVEAMSNSSPLGPFGGSCVNLW
jgi:hypothetical protein